MRSLTSELIKAKLIIIDSNVMQEDIDALEEYERLCNLEAAKDFNQHIYYNVLEWMKDNKQLREQIKDCINSLK
jgi:hypothetical protein